MMAENRLGSAARTAKLQEVQLGRHAIFFQGYLPLCSSRKVLDAEAPCAGARRRTGRRQEHVITHGSWRFRPSAAIRANCSG